MFLLKITIKNSRLVMHATKIYQYIPQVISSDTIQGSKYWLFLRAKEKSRNTCKVKSKHTETKGKKTIFMQMTKYWQLLFTLHLLRIFTVFILAIYFSIIWFSNNLHLIYYFQFRYNLYKILVEKAFNKVKTLNWVK